MKLSFSTLGCPNWDLHKIISSAAEMGFHAIELRGLLEDLDISRRPEFTSHLKETKSMLLKYGISVSAISISARFAVVDPAERREQFDEARRNMALAAELDAPVVRIYGGRIPKGYTLDAIMPILIRNLQEIGDEANDYGVILALETHDDWVDSRLCARLMREVNHPRIRVLWDLHHPYRIKGESPEETYANLAPYVVSIHVKDSIIDSQGKIKYVPLGEGNVPVKRMLELLLEGGYRGYATLEWEKRWHPDLLEPEIVFPQYVQKMREWLGKK
ncbi:MAG: sugar phosphate isomerase/epimerase family protein [Candidatus Bathyarchaeia archaeon]|nr:sugar phosphate isomerase/epimerase [Candidatus Bathyarchaeota archaeon]